MAKKNITNLSTLRELLMGDNSLVIETVESFLVEVPQDVETMKALHAEGNFKRVADLAHKKKPSFDYMGIDHGKQLAVEIEKAADDKDNSNLKEKISELQSICNQACKELNEKIQGLQ